MLGYSHEKIVCLQGRMQSSHTHAKAGHGIHPLIEPWGCGTFKNIMFEVWTRNGEMSVCMNRPLHCVQAGIVSFSVQRGF